MCFEKTTRNRFRLKSHTLYIYIYMGFEVVFGGPKPENQTCLLNLNDIFLCFGTFSGIIKEGSKGVFLGIKCVPCGTSNK